MPSPSKAKRHAGGSSSPASDASRARSTSEGPATSEGNTAPNNDDLRDGADFLLAPERDEDPGANNMGTVQNKPDR
jgi:hypothetical protein